MKCILDLKVVRKEQLLGHFVLLECSTAEGKPLPEMLPGQFANLRVDGSKETFLRRPISIHDVDRDANTVSFLIQCIGAGSRALARLEVGETLNTLLPLGKGFTLKPLESLEPSPYRPLLVGGGVGTAPLLYLGKELKRIGIKPTFLLGARTADFVLRQEEFKKVGDVYVTTEDGSLGEKGFVTNHSILEKEKFSLIQVCGPKPMMKAVAKFAKESQTPCEVSLENMMACGLGACLCCVEKTVKGNVCVCKEGPVFDINDLNW